MRIHEVIDRRLQENEVNIDRAFEGKFARQDYFPQQAEVIDTASYVSAEDLEVIRQIMADLLPQDNTH